MAQTRIVCRPDGTIRAIHCDGFPWHKLGEAEIRRASHVEVTADLSRQAKDWLACFRRRGDNQHYRGQLPLPPNKFWADMSPISGTAGPVLGPFDTRGEALHAEREWIEENWLRKAEAAQA